MIVPSASKNALIKHFNFSRVDVSITYTERLTGSDLYPMRAEAKLNLKSANTKLRGQTECHQNGCESRY